MWVRLNEVWFLASRAKVAELADAPDLGSGGRKALGVRLPPFARLRSCLRVSLGAQAGEGEGVPTVARSAKVGQGYNSPVKTEFADLTDTKKSVAVEIPSDIVDAEIDRVARSYSRQARIPGFRQGKVPPTLIKKRFREQILHDVAHDLIPRAIDEALRERGLEPVDTPDGKDVTLDAGPALT